MKNKINRLDKLVMKYSTKNQNRIYMENFNTFYC